MGLFSAVGKGVARCINEAITENRRKKAKQVAYKKVGKKLKKATKQHRYLNGSKAYQKELRKQNRKISIQYKLTDNFISDF